MTPPKVLIADAISQRGVDELSRDGAIEAVVKTGLSEKDLVDLIPDESHRRCFECRHEVARGRAGWGGGGQRRR